MQILHILSKDDNYPTNLFHRMGVSAPPYITALGNVRILQQPCIGLICSIQCPGSVVIRTLDVIRRLRDEMVVIAGGFHSPMERECLDLLLRGSQPLIVCPARSARNLRIGETARKALTDGRLLVLSFFSDEVTRTTAAQSVLRNDMVAALAEGILVPHASKNGKTWATVRRAMEYGQQVLTLKDEANTELTASGARAYGDDELDEIVKRVKLIAAMG